MPPVTCRPAWVLTALGRESEPVLQQRSGRGHVLFLDGKHFGGDPLNALLTIPLEPGQVVGHRVIRSRPGRDGERLRDVGRRAHATPGRDRGEQQTHPRDIGGREGTVPAEGLVCEEVEAQRHQSQALLHLRVEQRFGE
jgi:hypothetical protein